MPRIPRFHRLHLITQPSESQIAEAFKDTKDVLAKCRDLCRDLDIPASEVGLAFTIFHEQLRLKQQAEDERMSTKATRLVGELRKKNVSVPIAHLPGIGDLPSGYERAGGLVGRYDGLDSLSADEIIDLAKQHGIPVE